MDERLGIMVGPKGRGSNMRALIEASQSGVLTAAVTVVVSPVGDTQAVEFARDRGVPVRVIAPDEHYAENLEAALCPCTILCLAGFMRLLPTRVLDLFPRRVLNIHPSLLPKYGGKGMYGLRVHQAVLEGGEIESGCTVHLVTPIYDEGEIVLQKRCPVQPDDTPETLAARVLRLEHQAFPEAVQRIIDAGAA